MLSIDFEKDQLANLEYSLNRELIRSNRSGSFACTTIIGCNTRKYHGLLICPQQMVDGGNHVLLSSLDETIIQKEAEFNLAIHKFPGTYHPKGHKYIRSLTNDSIPKLTYRVGNVLLSKEFLFVHNDDKLLIRYTLEEAQSPIKIKFKPLLAFRNVHSLTKANVNVDKKFEEIENGIKLRMYLGYSYLHMQFSKKAEFVPSPDWYYNVEYMEERERGYDYQEDLYIPGYFELSMKKGESVVFSAGLSKAVPSKLSAIFKNDESKRIPRNSFENCLLNSSEQFIVKRDKKTEIIAGYPWFGSWGRDTFISLPGLTLATGKPKVCKAVIDSMISDLKGPLFPNIGGSQEVPYNSVDAPLWFFWALQQYAEYTDTKNKIWDEYGKKMLQILNGYRFGTDFNIKMDNNWLIFAGDNGYALTWMDAIVAGKPVTPRVGYCVEINALWYNAIMFSLEVAKLAKNKTFIKEWKHLPGLIIDSFKETFWSKEKGYLADYVCGDFKDWAVRPNQVIATSMPYSVVSEQIRKLVLDITKSELLTPRGLRTLSPRDANYKGTYCGNPEARDSAYHQGTVWPWLIGHFAEGYLKINGKSGLAVVKRIYDGFKDTITEYGVGSIAEIYDGDPPHKAGGAISQAWSVAEVLRIGKLIEKYSK
ncbi:MAG: amylo-alpha-1,6-glucosidase [Bacteroidales bacterium]